MKETQSSGYKSQGMELPLYFGKGMAGTHISVILSQEMANSGITIIERA